MLAECSCILFLFEALSFMGEMNPIPTLPFLGDNFPCGKLMRKLDTSPPY